MGDNSSHLKWTDDQWAKIRQVVHEEATRTRVGASFLPQYGPLPADAVTVPYPLLINEAKWQRFPGDNVNRLEVDDYHTKPLLTIAVEIYLTNAQMSDPMLSSAMTMFRRAANVVARVEDWIVFRGKNRVYHPWGLDSTLKASLAAAKALADAADSTNKAAATAAYTALQTAVGVYDTAVGLYVQGSTPIIPDSSTDTQGDILVNPRIFEVRPKDWKYEGLVDTDLYVTVGHQVTPTAAKAAALAAAYRKAVAETAQGAAPPSAAPATVTCIDGSDLVTGVVKAIQLLETNGHLGPFACVLGDDLFTIVNTPQKDSMVLPSDRITPFLNGPLLRTSVLDDDIGVVVSLAGAPVELVVAQDLTVNFLQVDMEPRAVFRVSERIMLRIKERHAIVRLQKTPDGGTSGPGPDMLSASSDRDHRGHGSEII